LSRAGIQSFNPELERMRKGERAEEARRRERRGSIFLWGFTLRNDPHLLQIKIFPYFNKSTSYL
jgi:hypothetical protein